MKLHKKGVSLVFIFEVETIGRSEDQIETSVKSKVVSEENSNSTKERRERKVLEKQEAADLKLGKRIKDTNIPKVIKKTKGKKKKQPVN